MMNANNRVTQSLAVPGSYRLNFEIGELKQSDRRTTEGN